MVFTIDRHKYYFSHLCCKKWQGGPREYIAGVSIGVALSRKCLHVAKKSVYIHVVRGFLRNYKNADEKLLKYGLYTSTWYNDAGLSIKTNKTSTYECGCQSVKEYSSSP